MFMERGQVKKRQRERKNKGHNFPTYNKSTSEGHVHKISELIK